MTDPGGRRLGWLLLGYLGAVVAMIVLAPFHFDPSRLGQVGWTPIAQATISDLLLNVVLFLPLGFLYERLGGGQRSVLRVTLLLAGVSALVEIVQLMLPGRFR